MKISRVLSIGFSALILAALIWYGQAVFLRDPLEGKEAHLGKVRQALDLMPRTKRSADWLRRAEAVLARAEGRRP